LGVLVRHSYVSSTVPDYYACSHLYGRLNCPQTGALCGATGDKEDVLGKKLHVLCLPRQNLLQVDRNLGSVSITPLDTEDSRGLRGGLVVEPAGERKRFQQRHGLPLVQNESASLDNFSN